MVLNIPSKTKRILDTKDLAKTLTDDQRGDLESRVKRGFESDEASRAQWLNIITSAMQVAMQMERTKTGPFPGSANVMYPLISIAALQFQARSYHVMVPGGKLVKAKITGDDPNGEKAARGDRIGQHMSWQLLEQMEGWEAQTDMMLPALAILGCMFRKVYFSAHLKRNVSEIIFPQDLVVAYNAKSLAEAQRVTHIIRMNPDDVISRQRSGYYLDENLDMDDEENDEPIVFLEQHRRYDLDGDGYPEPYIVTTHQKTGFLVRIVPCFDETGITMDSKGRIERVEKIQYFAKYEFLTSPDGGFYSVGFGSLLGHINLTINSTLNMLLDAGRLANQQGGFIGNGIRLAAGRTSLYPGEYKFINAPGGKIRENIVPMTYPGPSPVLINLLTFLIDTGKQLSSVQDIMTGQVQPGETATTSMIRTEQGAKLFTSIAARLHRAFRQELKLLFRLNSIYLDEREYFTVLDTEQQEHAGISDYNMEDFDVTPASDPNIASDQHRLMQSQAIMQLIGHPLINPEEVLRRYLASIKVENIDALMVKPDANPKPPPEVVIEMAKLEIANRELALNEKTEAVKAEESVARSLKLLAEAEAVEVGPQLEMYKMELQQVGDELNRRFKSEESIDKQGRMVDMEEPSGDAGVFQPPEGLPGPAQEPPLPGWG
jgi:chaperonin GroES